MSQIPQRKGTSNKTRDFTKPLDGHPEEALDGHPEEALGEHSHEALVE